MHKLYLFDSNHTSIKDACPVYFDQNCLHPLFKPYLSSEFYSRKYERLPNIIIHHVNILQKKRVDVDASTHYDETVK